MISTNLRRLREYKNYSQEYMAEQLGIKQNTYSRYETGEVLPKLDMLKRAAEVLEVPEQQLLSSDALILTQNNNENSSFGYIVNNHVPSEVLDKFLKQNDERFRQLETLCNRLADIIEKHMQGR